MDHPQRAILEPIAPVFAHAKSILIRFGLQEYNLVYKQRTKRRQAAENRARLFSASRGVFAWVSIIQKTQQSKDVSYHHDVILQIPMPLRWRRAPVSASCFSNSKAGRG
jgi:hypothetical protein